jgi:hypothetical protein
MAHNVDEVTMLGIRSRTAAFVIVSTLLIVGKSTAQEVGTCKADITSPKKGDSVSTSGDVRGTATVPPGMFLWVFSQREGLAKWWPQSGGPARVRDGEWVVHAIYGDEKDPSKDAGANFVITAVVVDQKANDEIVKYVKKSENDNYYPGMDLPAANPGCASKDIIAKRR